MSGKLPHKPWRGVPRDWEPYVRPPSLLEGVMILLCHAIKTEWRRWRKKRQ